MSGLNLADVRKLQIQDGDVLILPDHVDHATLSEFMGRLRELEPAPKNVTVACCQIEQISEAQMNAAGWYRK
ncbi:MULTISPECIES: hypothetical protein [Pseudomonadaceae]|uniref:Uncharacterized protein n=1 Tax=Pseudomonas abyssi TaxID=170540 RepID=A0A395R2S0_9PSED|nr:hypothetical protein [Halopseudomonas gallaeciensis]RGP54420.1 hypothetical protein ASB58_11100 [Halopseudomonas gallaeciensis]